MVLKKNKRWKVTGNYTGTGVLSLGEENIWQKYGGEKWAVFQPKGVDGKKKAVEQLYQSSLCFILKKSCSFIDSYFQPVFVSIN